MILMSDSIDARKAPADRPRPARPRSFAALVAEYYSGGGGAGRAEEDVETIPTSVRGER